MTPTDTIRLARRMSAEQLSESNRLDSICPDAADAALSASRALHAISACASGVDAKTARAWAASDREIAERFGCRISAHTANMLDLLASRLP